MALRSEGLRFLGVLISTGVVVAVAYDLSWRRCAVGEDVCREGRDVGVVLMFRRVFKKAGWPSERHWVL